MLIFKYECKKLFPSSLCLIFVLLFLLNAVSILADYVNEKNLKNDLVFETANRELKTKLSGQLSEENKDFLQEEYTRLNNLLYYGKGDLGLTALYTDSLVKDLSLIRSVKEEYDYFYTYENYAKLKASWGKEQKTAPEAYLAAFGEKIESIFSYRTLSLYKDLSAQNKLLSYHRSSLFLILFLLFFLTPVFVSERESHMDILLLTSARQGTAAATRYIIVFFTIIASSLLFFAEDRFLFEILYRPVGSELPLCSLQAFRDTPLDITISGYYKTGCFVKIMGLCLISSFFLFISSKSRHILSALLLNSFAICVLVFVFSVNETKVTKIFNRANPISLIQTTHLFTECNFYKLFNIPVYDCLINFILTGALSIVFVVAANITFRSRKGGRKT